MSDSNVVRLHTALANLQKYYSEEDVMKNVEIMIDAISNLIEQDILENTLGQFVELMDSLQETINVLGKEVKEENAQWAFNLSQDYTALIKRMNDLITAQESDPNARIIHIYKIERHGYYLSQEEFTEEEAEEAKPFKYEGKAVVLQDDFWVSLSTSTNSLFIFNTKSEASAHVMFLLNKGVKDLQLLAFNLQDLKKAQDRFFKII